MNFLLHYSPTNNTPHRDILLALRQENVVKDQYIFYQGDVGENFYIIAKGSVSVIKDEKAVTKLSNGNIFGELALLYGTPRNASIKVWLVGW